MSSLRGRAWLEMVVVGPELAVDDFGELALEAAEGFGGRLVFGAFALVVRLAGAGMHGLDACGHMQGVIERTEVPGRRPWAAERGRPPGGAARTERGSSASPGRR